MKRVLMLAAAMLFVATGALAQEVSTSKLMEATLAKGNVLMQFSYDYTQDASKTLPAQKFSAQAVCLTKDGLFMTFGVGGGMRPTELNNAKLTAPGENGKSVKAEYLWTDRETNISFVRATEGQGTFTPVTFNAAATFKTGARLLSVGVYEDDPARSLYVAVGYISGVFRLPGQLVMVSGGSVANDGAPVLNEEGQFVGICISQFMRQQVRTQQGVQEMAMDNKSLGHFIRPASEFAHVIEYAIKNPTKKRQLSWLGVLSFDPVEETSLVKLDKDTPAVMVGKLAKGGPAESAGLKQNDVIVAMDDKKLESFASPALVRNAFALKLFRATPGQKIKLTIRRDDKQQDITVAATAQPQDETEVARYIVSQLGFLVRERSELDKFIMPEEISNVDGLLVLQVAKTSPADKANLQPLDMITTINNEPVNKISTFKTLLDKAMKDLKPGASIAFGITRGKEKPFILAITPPAENEKPAP